MTLVDSTDEDDDLALGRPPRAPMSARTRHLLSIGIAVLAAAALVVVLLVRPGADRPSAAPSDTPSPLVESSAGFAAGPVLIRVGDQDALQAPGLPGRTSTPKPLLLDSAPDLVAAVSAALPGFRDVRGGRVASPDDRYGAYLAGNYDGTGGVVSVSLYTARAPGTTFGTDQYVSRTRFDREYTVRTDVAVFTGSGWWVHVVTLGPDDPAATERGEIGRLLPLASDPQLVS